MSDQSWYQAVTSLLNVIQVCFLAWIAAKYRNGSGGPPQGPLDKKS